MYIFTGEKYVFWYKIGYCKCTNNVVFTILEVYLISQFISNIILTLFYNIT